MLSALTARRPPADVLGALLACAFVGCSGGAATPPRDPPPVLETPSAEPESAPSEVQVEAGRYELDAPPTISGLSQLEPDGAAAP